MTVKENRPLAEKKKKEKKMGLVLRLLLSISLPIQTRSYEKDFKNKYLGRKQFFFQLFSDEKLI